MKSAQQGAFSCQNVAFLVDWCVLYQGRGIPAFQTGRDICSQKKSLSIYTREGRKDSVYLCAPWVQWLSVEVRKYYLPPCSAHRSSAKIILQSFNKSSWTPFICLPMFVKHPKSYMTGPRGLYSFLCVCVCVCMHVCWPFKLQDPRKRTVPVLWVCTTLGTLGTQWNSLYSYNANKDYFEIVRKAKV